MLSTAPLVLCVLFCANTKGSHGNKNLKYVQPPNRFLPHWSAGCRQGQTGTVDSVWSALVQSKGCAVGGFLEDVTFKANHCGSLRVPLTQTDARLTAYNSMNVIAAQGHPRRGDQGERSGAGWVGRQPFGGLAVRPPHQEEPEGGREGWKRGPACQGVTPLLGRLPPPAQFELSHDMPSRRLRLGEPLDRWACMLRNITTT